MSAPPDTAWLQGKEVAFTGKLASLTRGEAARLIQERGGIFAPSVRWQTDLLVVGQEGWPLRRDGSLSLKLQRAHKLQKLGHAIAVLTEEDFLERLGLATSSSEIHRLFTTAQVCRMLRVPRDRLRAWIKAGLLAPAQSVHNVCYFDFQQVTGMRSLCDLTRSGVTSTQLKRSFEQLKKWLPDVDRPLAQLADGRLLVRLEHGLAEPTGQLQFDFSEEAETPSSLALPTQGAEAERNAAQWWEEGCRLEDEQQFAEAEQAYRRALLLGGPDPRIVFNLGNVLYAQGKKQQAYERFHQVVEVDATYADAWNNLGNVLVDLKRLDEAQKAYERCLQAQPFSADTHYNLADLLDQLGRRGEARRHWQSYLRQQPLGPWADYARSRLG